MAMTTPSSPGLAVSGLMQQLKSGEISKMQLFQQIAKLQTVPAVSNNPTALIPNSSPAPQEIPVPLPTTASISVRPSAPMSMFAIETTTNATSTTIAQPPISVTGSILAATRPAIASSTSFNLGISSVSTAPPVVQASLFTPPLSATNFTSSLIHNNTNIIDAKPLGATMVENDADFLAAGVSHDKAPSLSVQEWIASKTRPSVSTQVSNALRQHYQQNNQPSPPIIHQHSQQHHYYQSQNHHDSWGLNDDEYSEGASSSSKSQSQASRDPFDGRMQLNDPNLQSTETKYVYNPQRHFGQSFANGGDAVSLNEHEYIDFTEQFRDDNHDHGSENGNTTANKSVDNTDNDNTKFHTRVTRWKSQKDAIREQMKQQLLQSELDECTFTPKINPKSTKVAAKLRGRQAGKVKVDENTPLAASERLYQEADTYKAREELAAKLKAEEEAELERECTFKPKINRNNPLTDKVRAKYRNIPANPPSSLTTAAMEANAKELEECTFYPKVNPISSEMISAQLYLQQDIYERLSRPYCMTNDSPRRNSDGNKERPRRRSETSVDYPDDDDDNDTYLNGSTGGFHSPASRRSRDDFYLRSSMSSNTRRGRTSVSSGTRAHRSRPRPRSAGGEPESRADKEERAGQFNNFIERQRFHEQARQKKIEMTKQQLEPGYKPTINKTSLAMMENGRKGDFLERITKYAIRKEQDNVKKKTVRITDPNCTFKPTINQISAKRKARSVTELSRGDLLRRETTQRLMKLKMEQEEMAALTFRPQLNRVSERHEGKLKILTSPDTYMQRIQQQSQAHTIKQRRAIQEKEMEEFAECTFKPRTIEAPAYVQRIARSISLTKALKEQQQAAAKTHEKPEWK